MSRSTLLQLNFGVKQVFILLQLSFCVLSMYTKTVKIVVLYSFSLQYIPDFDKKLLPLEILTLIFSNQGENTLLKTAASQPY